jgi:glycosyltransferase involved in cell wall biosynthesis
MSSYRSPLVSVITICRNSESLIESTMVSVLSQEYDFLEYIVVDGKSEDETLREIMKVKSMFSERKVRVVCEADVGIADAMNKGVLASRGEIFIHLHAGDEFVSNSVITDVIHTYEELPWRWAVASSIVTDEKGNKIHVYTPCKDRNTLVWKNSIPHQSTFLTRDVFDKNGLFRTDLKQGMDYEYWLRLVFKGDEEFVCLPFPTTYFLAGGRSSRVFELTKYLVGIRRDLHSWNSKVSIFDDAIFLSRIWLFSIYACLISRISGFGTMNFGLPKK